MRDMNDMELLQAYVRQGSEPAFAEVVERHLNLVYSTALRHVGIAAQAEELTQAVFIILARKAAGLRSDTVLEAWLYESTRLTSISFLRGERRRQFREQEAYMQSTLQDVNTDSAWEQLAPLLDEAMSKLGKKDREAVVLRFFNEKSLREVAEALGMNEAAARKRVGRALDKLRQIFAKRGIIIPSAVLMTAISAHSIQAAPIGLSKTVTAVASAKGAAAGSSTLTLAKGALKIMAWTKVKTAVVIGSLTLIAATTSIVVKNHTPNLSATDLSWVDDDRFWVSEKDNLDRLPPVFILRETKFPKATGGMRSAGGTNILRSLFRNQSTKFLISEAYWHNQSRTVYPSDLLNQKIDFICTLPGYHEVLANNISNRLGLIAHRETRVTDVLLLKLKNPEAPRIQVAIGNDAFPSTEAPYCRYIMKNASMGNLADWVESFLTKPILDRTGLSGRYDIDIDYAPKNGQTLNEALQEALLNQIGFELVPSREPVEMLVVERVRK